jgi:hypothetical protein
VAREGDGGRLWDEAAPVSLPQTAGPEDTAMEEWSESGTDDRFEQLHRHAIGFPGDKFSYIGIDDEGDTTEHYAGEVC